MSQGQGQASRWARPETRVSNSALLNVPEENALWGRGRGGSGRWRRMRLLPYQEPKKLAE